MNEELGRHSDRDGRVECTLCGAECERVAHMLWECSTLLKKGCYGNTFRGARRTVLLWHPKGVTIGVITHPKGVLFGVNTSLAKPHPRARKHEGLESGVIDLYSLQDFCSPIRLQNS